MTAAAWFLLAWYAVGLVTVAWTFVDARLRGQSLRQPRRLSLVGPLLGPILALSAYAEYKEARRG